MLELLCYSAAGSFDQCPDSFRLLQDCGKDAYGSVLDALLSHRVTLVICLSSGSPDNFLSYDFATVTS